MRRLLRRLALAAAALAILLAAALFVFVRRPLPPRSGIERLPGLDGPVTIEYDARAIPHVRARTTLDAMRALGWLHAGDRLLQMETRRRAALGTLSAVFGPKALDYDREARLLGHRVLAERALEAADEETRAILEAYAEGVNAYLGSNPLPIEITAAGFRPEPWRPADSLAFASLMYHRLSEARERGRSALRSIRHWGLDAALPTLPPGTVVPPGIGTLPPPDPSGPAPRPLSAPAGSNAWAVAGSRTASGGALLCGDPHLGPEMPGVWYAADLRADDGFHAFGLTLAGIPGVPIGGNDRVAWSITMHQADDVDLFLEHVDASGERYEDDGAWVPLERRTETIEVAGAAPVRLDVTATRRGSLTTEDGVVWSEAIAFTREPISLRPFLDADRAADGDGLRRAFAAYRGPAFNVVWADATGSIGAFVAGAIPSRRAGDGRLPQPGWDPAWGWEGLFPPPALPSVIDPPEGFVASANDDWSAAGLVPPYPGFWASPWRVRRIREVLEADAKADVGAMRSLQNDHLSGYAIATRDALASRSFDDRDAAAARDALAAWDGSVERRGPSLLFFTFLRELRRSASPAAPPPGWGALLDLVRAGGPTVAPALSRAYREVGSDPARWDFGARHRLLYRHPFVSLFDVGPVELPGEVHTVGVAGFSLADPFAVRHIASARWMRDFGDGTTRIVLPLGESGQVFDLHRSDQLDAWSHRRDFPFVEAPRVSRVDLAP